MLGRSGKIKRDDAVMILEAGGLTSLQATQFCGRRDGVSVASVVLALKSTRGSKEGQADE